MKIILLPLLLIFSCSIQAQNVEVQKTITTFFEGFHVKDTIKMKTTCAEKIILQSIHENKNRAKLSNENASEFYKSIASIPDDLKFEEKILSYSIQVDGTMAHVWTPYEFYINDKLSHKGVNAFTLFRENDFLKIIYVIDTKRK